MKITAKYFLFIKCFLWETFQSFFDSRTTCRAFDFPSFSFLKLERGAEQVNMFWRCVLFERFFQAVAFEFFSWVRSCFRRKANLTRHNFIQLLCSLWSWVFPKGNFRVVAFKLFSWRGKRKKQAKWELKTCWDWVLPGWKNQKLISQLFEKVQKNGWDPLFWFASRNVSLRTRSWVLWLVVGWYTLTKCFPTLYQPLKHLNLKHQFQRKTP